MSSAENPCLMIVALRILSKHFYCVLDSVFTKSEKMCGFLFSVIGVKSPSGQNAAGTGIPGLSCEGSLSKLGGNAVAMHGRIVTSSLRLTASNCDHRSPKYFFEKITS
jgi:hypothetical protein